MQRKKMENSHVLYRGILVLIISGLILAGILVDQVHKMPPSSFPVFPEDSDRFFYLPGIVIKLDAISLEYNGCDTGVGKEYEHMLLFTSDSLSFETLSPGVTHDVSVAEFVYLNLHQDGAEFIGQIGLMKRRSFVGRILLWISFVFPLIGYLVPFVFAKASSFYFFEVMIGLSGFIVWIGLTYLSSMLPTLLSHLFRETEVRCKIPLNDHPGHELYSLSRFVDETSSFPNGITVWLCGGAFMILLLYAVFRMLVFYIEKNIRTNRKLLLSINSTTSMEISGLRTLSWYARVWQWYTVLLVFAIAIVCHFFVTHSNRIRGFPLNVLYMNYGSKIAEKTGLSKSGTLLDFVQDSFQLVALPSVMVQFSVSVWLFIIPIIAISSQRKTRLILRKALQDLCVLSIMRALIAWVTVVPTSMSMFEDSICFQEPKSGWRNCNFSMFSRHTIWVLVPCFICIYFVKFNGYEKYSRIINLVAALLAGAVFMAVTVARYQYTSEVFIGIFICASYMLTQRPAYQLLFNQEWNIHYDKPFDILQDKVVVGLQDCIDRIKKYNLAISINKFDLLTSDELNEIKIIYNKTGRAIDRARGARSVVPSPMAVGTPIKVKKDQ